MSRSVLLFSAALLAATPTFAPAGEPVPRRPEAIGRPMWTAFTTRWRVRSNNPDLDTGCCRCAGSSAKLFRRLGAWGSPSRSTLHRNKEARRPSARRVVGRLHSQIDLLRAAYPCVKY